MAKCYICSTNLIKNKNRQRDHVPPECVFPEDDKPPNLITVLCCAKCHSEFGELDERMRNYLAILAGESSAEAGDKARRVVLRSRKLQEDFLSHTQSHPSLVDSDGRPRSLFFFDDKELERWLVRVVKGLYFHRNKCGIDDDAVYRIEKLPELTPQPSMTFPMEKGLEFRPYFASGVLQKPNSDFWVLIFYDRLIFTVTVESPCGSTPPNKSPDAPAPIGAG
jgi:hypothetical protein